MIEFAKRSNLLVGTGFLSTKLIRWEAKNNETFVIIFLVKCFQSLVLWCKAAVFGLLLIQRCIHTGAIPYYSPL